MAEETAVKPVEKKPKKKGGCLRGCLIFFLVLLLLIGAATAMIFEVPRRMGWVKGPGEKLAAMTPERYTAEQIVAEAETKGFNAKDVEVYVFPKDDSDEAVLFAVYDFSSEADLPEPGQHHPVVQALLFLGGGEKAAEYKVTHVGAAFHDEEGKLIMEVAASTADIRALADGEITEEEFLSRLGKDVDLPNYFQRAVVPL